MTEENEVCIRCYNNNVEPAYSDDLRTLWMACFYDMNALNVPFDSVRVKDEEKNVERMFFTLQVCKDCRADWMNAIEKWFKTKPIQISCGSGIYIRENGANIEITEEEWNERYPGKTPVRFMG